MQIVIDIPEETYNDIQSRDWKNGELIFSEEWRAIHNGIPLDKIKAEIERQEKWLLQAGYTAYNVDIALDAIKAVVAERSDKE